MRLQVREVGEIKKAPEVALEKIKELEAKERAHGPTERSTQRKTELQVCLHPNFSSSLPLSPYCLFLSQAEAKLMAKGPIERIGKF